MVALDLDLLEAVGEPAEDDPAVGAGRLVLVVGRALEHHVDDRLELRVEQDVERLLAKPGHAARVSGPPDADSRSRLLGVPPGD